LKQLRTFPTRAASPQFRARAAPLKQALEETEKKQHAEEIPRPRGPVEAFKTGQIHLKV